MKDKKVSIVIPVYNEEGNIQKLYSELIDVIDPYEIVFVDDGSTDSSFEISRKLALKDKRVKVVRLLSNYGQSNAISAGIANSKGSIIVTMDADLQHNPRDIIPMIDKVKDGYHVVCGWRKYGASDSLIKKTIPSKISNFLIRKLTGIKLKDSTGGMRAFSRRVVEVIPLYGEMHRYLPILAFWKGFKVAEVPITIRKRAFGITKYNYKRIMRGFLDLATIKFLMKFSTRPTHVFGIVGFASLVIGIFVNLAFLYYKIFQGVHLSRNIPSIILGVVLILLGIMFLGFGFLADIVTYDAITSQKRETYLVDKIIGKR